MTSSVPNSRQILNAFGERLVSEGNLSPEGLERLLDTGKVATKEAGELLFSAGDHLEELLFVASGLVRYYYLTADGREFNKNFVSDGGVVTCLSSFLEKHPVPFFTQALEPTTLIALRMDGLREMRASDVEVERLISRFITKLALQKERREASFLLDDAAARYETFLREFSHLVPRLPQYHIASYLGITPVALSRIRARRTRRVS